VTARSVAVLGNHWDWFLPASRGSECSDLERVSTEAFSRQSLAFGPDFLGCLRYLRIGIVGAGATGSATAVLLARSGAGDLQLIDPDRVEESNLSRLHSARRADIGQLKVKVLARHLEDFGLGTRVSPHPYRAGNLQVRDALKSCDLIFGCTDDQAGRLFLNRLSYFYNLPWIDMGIGIDPVRLHDGLITAADGRVTVLGPGNPCLLCRRVVDSVKAREQELRMNSPEEYAQQQIEGYVSGIAVPDPAVITLTTSVAGMAVDEFTARVTGYRTPRDHRVRKFKLMKDTKPGARAECGLCGTADYWGIGDRQPFLDRVN